jgi:uncharacterized protein (TIGR02001 family)
VGASVSLFSDARFRGYSLSEGRPVGIVDFAWDDASGFYAGASGTAVLRPKLSPAPLGLELDGGWAKRLASGTTVDVGIRHSSYSRYSSGERGTSYTEIYAGFARGALSSRIFLSPDYFGRGIWTAYAELEGNVSLAPKWHADAHVGLLRPFRSAVPGRGYRSDVDWHVGLTRELGRLSLHVAWSDGAPGGDYYRDRLHSRSALVLGASMAL